MPSDHRRAKLACPSRPSFLFREQRMPSKRELTPPLCTLNQPLPFANFCFFQKKKTRDRSRSERQRTPETSGPGERVEHRRRQSPALASSPSLLPSPMFSDGTADAPAPAWSSPGNRPAGDRAQRYRGAVHPRVLPARGGRGAEAPMAIGNTVLASPAMLLAARPGSLGIYIIILLFFFFW